MAGCKDINEYVNEHLPLPSPWEKTSDGEDTWYVNEDTKESLWVRPDKEVFQAIVNRIKDGPTEKNNALDKLFTRATKVLIDLLGTPAIQLCFGEDKESEIKEIEDAAEKEIENKKNVLGIKKLQPKLLKEANITKNIGDIYTILDKLYKDKKDIFEKNKKATNIQRIFRGHKTRRNIDAIPRVWTRHTEENDEWFTSPTGESVWELPANVWTRHTDEDEDEVWYVSPTGKSFWKLPRGASVIDAAPNTKVEARAQANANAKTETAQAQEQEQKAKQNNLKEKEQEKEKEKKKQKCFKLLDLCGPPPGWSPRNTKNEKHLSEAEIKHKHEMNAIQKKQHEDAIKLIDEGVDMECAETGSGITPLMWAAAFAPEVAKKLIDKGANIHKVSARGASALIYAIESYNTSTALLLIEKGADINISAGTLLNSKVLKTALDFTYADDGYAHPQLDEVRKKLIEMGAETAATAEMQKRREEKMNYAKNSRAISAEVEKIKKDLEDAIDRVRMTRDINKKETARALVRQLQGKLEDTIAAWKRKYPNMGGSRRKNKTRRLR